MKNIMKRTFAAILAVTMLAVLVPHSAMAKDYTKYYCFKSIDLAQKKWTKTSDYTYKIKGDDCTFTYEALKVSVPENGYVKLESKSTSSKICISDTLKPGKVYNDSQYRNNICKYMLSGSKTYSMVLPKGTYYLYADQKGVMEVKYTFVASKNTTNYDRASATKLGSKKKTTIVFNDGHEYSRWFKVKASSKKKLTITLKQIDGNSIDKVTDYFTVFGPTGKKITCSKTSGNNYKTSQAVPAGKYCYIRIDYPFFWDAPWTDTGRIWELSWK